jgi:hypothetical protein
MASGLSMPVGRRESVQSRPSVDVTNLFGRSVLSMSDAFHIPVT